jgi:hypothetical protein
MQSYAIKVITGMMMSGFAAMYLHVDNRFEHLEAEVKEIKGTLNDILLAVKKD